MRHDASADRGGSPAGRDGPDRAALGRAAEAAARRHLEAQGLACVAANFRSRRGELDLVMLDGPVLVAVEVRYRADARYGGAAASVDPRKQRRLLAAAGWLLATRPALATRRLRFDVVAVSGADGAFRIDWLRDAFRA